MQVPNSTDFGISIEKTVFVSVIGQSFLLINGKNSSRGKDSG